MITHFQYYPLYKQANIPGWRFTFYFQKNQYAGIYHRNGEIEWTSPTPPTNKEANICAQIHELMLFHVYEN